ncbi:histidine kinase dimerization/phospho-acceptor domain-containing protein [Nonomuraea terrae]|uniref:histidine kinase dimerization/phospho-acceptor domain-containing protein n=1 Tax=Nonomuraea terrae TaxID=2530383 RepID=UPI00378E8DF8
MSAISTSEPRPCTYLLDAMAGELELINHGDTGRRMTEAADAAATRLVRAINAALARSEEAEKRARCLLEEQCRLGADAAHALRTPVAALRAELEEAVLNRGHVDLDELLSRTLSAVGRLQEVIEQLQLLAGPSVAVLEAGGYGERLRRFAPR